jgi:predicted GH43/DUF377 family glycosyl hydrolase
MTVATKLPPVIKRYDSNPILTKDDIPYPVETVHNAGITRYDDRIIMLFRSHLRSGRSIIGIAESVDGFKFTVGQAPFMVPSIEGSFAEYEAFGVEDPRICCIDGEFLMERVSLISESDMRNVVIFPARFNGRYARLDRPHSEISPWSVWLSWSPDLIHWGDSEVVMKPVPYHWDESKIGPGATPIRTDRGWLCIYHGVFETMDGAVYRLGVALHDLVNPAKIIGIADEWVLAPEDPWEITGYVHNVVFTCGTVEDDDGDVKIYWGGADTVMCVGTARVDDLVDLCLDNSRLPF